MVVERAPEVVEKHLEVVENASEVVEKTRQVVENFSLVVDKNCESEDVPLPQPELEQQPEQTQLEASRQLKSICSVFRSTSAISSFIRNSTSIEAVKQRQRKRTKQIMKSPGLSVTA